MITAVTGPLVVEPEVWMLVFNRVASKRWTSWIAMGRYKHVRAYAYVPFLHVWVFYDPRFRGTSITVAADGPPAQALIREWIRDADLIRMRRVVHTTRRFPVFGWCVPSIKQLIGLRTWALRPDSLYRDCVRSGGALFECVAGESVNGMTAAHGRHTRRRLTSAGTGGPTADPVVLNDGLHDGGRARTNLSDATA